MCFKYDRIMEAEADMYNSARQEDTSHCRWCNCRRARAGRSQPSVLQCCRLLQCCREAVGGEEIREMQNWHLLISDYRHLQLATLHSILCCAISYILPCLPSTMDQWLPPTIFVIADGSIQDCTINVEVLSSHHLFWVRVLTQSSHHGPAHNTAPLHPRRL